MALKGSHGFWGPPTSTINWCEQDYTWTPYVAEFFNTVSNLALVLFSGYGVRMCVLEQHSLDLLVLFALIAVIGVGSALFHGTLLRETQFLDEAPMIFAVVQFAFTLYKPLLPHTETHLWTLLIAAHNVVFAAVHAATMTVLPFQVYFIGWVLLGSARMLHLYRTELKDVVVKGLVISYLAVAAVGAACWLFDQHFCKLAQALPVNPQGHALWHLCVGYSSYVGPCALAYYVASREKRSPRVTYLQLGVPTLPYVHADVEKMS
jgi:dihydroceramidase